MSCCDQVVRGGDRRPDSGTGVGDTPAPRRLKITKADLSTHGYSARCDGCRAALAGRPAQNHSEECRRRVLEAIGKDDPRLGAQKQRFNEFLDKAATKEDSDDVRQERKRVRSEGPEGGAEIQTTATVRVSEDKKLEVQTRGEKRVSEDDGRADLDEAQLETAKRAAEQALEILRRSNKRVSSSVEDGLEKRARIPETRGSKRPSEDDGRADLDSVNTNNGQNDVNAIRTQTHISSRWCDMADESLVLDEHTRRWNDPLVNLDSWTLPLVRVKEGRRTVDVEQKDERSEGRALREAPHVSREPDTSELRAESEFEPSGIDHPAEVVRHRPGGSFLGQID